jgi:hypothetical protein
MFGYDYLYLDVFTQIHIYLNFFSNELFVNNSLFNT